MADSLKASLDSAQWDALFGKLTGEVRESLARRMGVSGGVILRDEAQFRAPQGVAEAGYMRPFGGSKRPGALKGAIYLAYRDGESTNTSVKYSITWNAKKAPHGHLVEFGHWINEVIVFDPKTQNWFTLPGKMLDQPKWVPGTPFLRPAFEAKLTQVKAAMIDRGRAEVQILLRG